MNFASHFFLDGIEGRPYYNFGLVLPDLASIFKRGWRIADRNNVQEMNQRNMDIFSGILKHYELDAIFHQSMFFNEHTKMIKDLLKQEKLQLIQLKRHFVAHVLLELIIDRVVVKRDETVLHKYYKCLDRITEEDVLSFFSNDNFTFIKSFFEFFEKFRAKRFLYKYSENESVIFVLNKVLERVGLLPFSSLSDLERLDIILTQTETVVDDDFRRILEIRNNENL